VTDAKSMADNASGFLRDLRIGGYNFEIEQLKSSLDQYLTEDVSPDLRQIATSALSHIEEMEKALSLATDRYHAASEELGKLTAQTPGEDAESV
jgi:hypothetical protein